MDKVVTAIAASDYQDAWWQYGAIAIIAGVLALVVRFLYTRKETKDDQVAVERAAWQVERQKMLSDHTLALEKARSDYEEQLHKQADTYAQRLREDLKEAQSREDAIRKEFAEVTETIATEIQKMSIELGRVLDKIYERFLGPRPRY